MKVVVAWLLSIVAVRAAAADDNPHAPGPSQLTSFAASVGLHTDAVELRLEDSIRLHEATWLHLAYVHDTDTGEVALVRHLGLAGIEQRTCLEQGLACGIAGLDLGLAYRNAFTTTYRGVIAAHLAVEAGMSKGFYVRVAFETRILEPTDPTVTGGVTLGVGLRL